MELAIIHSKIHEIRGQKVMLDFDLAELYGVLTKVLNQSVKRNMERFPEDFMFQLAAEEWQRLRSQFVTLNPNWSQIVTSSRKHRGISYLPYAFTEQGVAMLSSVLNSEKAIRVNIAIMRTFVALRRHAFEHSQLTEKIAELERKYDKEFADINEVLQFLGEENQQRADEIETLQPKQPQPSDWSERPRIGFKK